MKESSMRILRKYFQNKTALPDSSLDEKLQQIDQKIAFTRPNAIPSLFSEIPLDTFGNLLLDVPAQYPNMKAFFPTMPPDDIQDKWNSRHGKVLLEASLAFIKTLVTGYSELREKDLKSSTVLDYGCGWGRLIRLLYKYVSYENLYGVDPWDTSIDLCKQYGIKANLAVCDYVPQELPFEQKFDLIFAHSVFTHLSEKTAKTVLETLRKYVDDKGVLVITIRPKRFWSFHQQGKFENDMYQMHEERGFAFHPHRRAPINGEITYGDTSISLGYIEENYRQWELDRLIIDRNNPYQTVLFLRPT
jgi:SAM-dependent methyltransferase